MMLTKRWCQKTPPSVPDVLLEKGRNKMSATQQHCAVLSFSQRLSNERWRKGVEPIPRLLNTCGLCLSISYLRDGERRHVQFNSVALGLPRFSISQARGREKGKPSSVGWHATHRGGGEGWTLAAIMAVGWDQSGLVMSNKEKFIEIKELTLMTFCIWIYKAAGFVFCVVTD